MGNLQSNKIRDSDDTTNIIINETENITMTNNGSVSATITDSLIDSNRKIQYNTSLNADAGLIPSNDYDVTSKKYVDDALGNLQSNKIRDSDDTTNIVIDETEKTTFTNNGSATLQLSENNIRMDQIA